MAFDTSELNPQELAYDLRQIYARLVGEHLVTAAEYRKVNDFYNWLNALKDIKTVTQHKWKKKEEKIKLYNEMLKKIYELANKYKTTWLRKSQDQKELEEIKTVLRNLEEFLYQNMSDAKMFGESSYNPHL